MLRDNPEGSSSRCSAAREIILPRCTLTEGSHRTIDPHALKIPARRAEYSLTENVASPFQAEPRHTRKLQYARWDVFTTECRENPHEKIQNENPVRCISLQSTCEGNFDRPRRRTHRGNSQLETHE